MNFTRKKKRGVNKAVCKFWFSDEGYRITWRRETFGVAIEPRYMAAVKTLVPNYGCETDRVDEFVMFDKVDPGRPRLYKSLKAAQEACEAHLQLWTQACEAAGIRALIELFGKVPGVIPVWARKGKLNRHVLAILMAPQTRNRKFEEDECPESTSADACESSPDAPTEVSDTSVSISEAASKNPTPASPVTDTDGSMTLKTRRVRSKATSIETDSPAPIAEEAKAPRKRVSKPTKDKSPSTKPKERRTKPSPAVEKKPSPNSRKKKSKRSES